jgi:hypothetical protein
MRLFHLCVQGKQNYYMHCTIFVVFLRGANTSLVSHPACIRYMSYSYCVCQSLKFVPYACLSLVLSH